MAKFRTWLEDRLPAIERARETLLDSKLGGRTKELLRQIELADPYPDKRWAPAIARWLAAGKIKKPDEHRSAGLE